MFVQTDSTHSDRIVFFLTPLLGPFTQDGPLAGFDPRRDLEVYVDGDLVPVRTAFFNSVQNCYVLFMDRAIDVQGTIQIIHHVPNPPFFSITTPVVPTPVVGAGATATTTTLTPGAVTIAPYTPLVLAGLVTNGGPTPNGNVALYDNEGTIFGAGTPIANVALDGSGQVIFVIGVLTTGVHVLRLDYLGTATYQPSTDNTTVTVTA